MAFGVSGTIAEGAGGGGEDMGHTSVKFGGRGYSGIHDAG